jgi:hypothetical protein
VFPVGPDGPVYTWWTRYADALGLAGVAPGRPGGPAAALVLGTALRTEPHQTVMLLGPVLAAAAGMASAALLEATLGPRSNAPFFATVLTGSFAAFLAGGWLANMAQAVLFMGALAALATASRSWRGAVVGGGLLAAAGLAHALFHLIGLAIVLGTIAILLVTDRRSGREPRMAGRMGVAAVAGSGAAGLGLLTLVGGPAVPGDVSQDGFFRRAGLTALLRDRYAERFTGDASRMALPLAVGTGMAAPGFVGSDAALGSREPGPRYLRAVLVAWAALTSAGIVVLLITRWGPPNRLLVFAFFVPVAAAIGLSALLARGRAMSRVEAVLGVVMAIGLGVFVEASINGWVRQAPSFAPEELARAESAGAIVERVPRDVPVILLVDTDEPAAAFHVTRFGNVLRMGLPPERIPTSYLAVGTPQDFLAGRPTLTGDREHDRIASVYFREVEALTDRAAVLVVDLFNPGGYSEAAELGEEVAPGVTVVRGPEISLPAPRPSDPAGLGRLALALLSVASLAALFVLGLGWARWALPGAGRLAAAMLAPSTGLAVALLSGFAVDRVSAGAAAPWGLPVAVAVAAVGYVAAARARAST